MKITYTYNGVVLIDWYDFEEWQRKGITRLAKKMSLDTVYGKKLMELLVELSEKELEIITIHFGLNNGKAQFIRQMTPQLGSAHAIRKIEQMAFQKLKVLYEGVEDDISFLGLSTRTYNALMRAGYSSIKKIKTTSSEELLKIRFFGTECLAELQEALKNY